MDYRESLEFLYGLQRFGIKLGLENIRLLLDRLDRPDRAFPVVHVGGTNGKGSTAAALAEILRCSGLRTGLYTSPHLHSFTERIRVDGLPIPEAEVGHLVSVLRRHAADLPATFFEFTTALALEHFRRGGVDVAVLEVGMGGRLDATNAVEPCLCVLTPIGLDHAEHLGSDLVSVAGEKGGILKPGVPLVLGRQEPEAAAVLEEIAGRLAVPCFRLGEEFTMQAWGGRCTYRGLDRRLEGLRPGLLGAHQRENLAVALAAAELLVRRGWPIPDGAMRRGVSTVRWPGRLEWHPGGILLDGAHNPGGARVLADYLETLRSRPIRAVIGLKGDKQAGGILSPLRARVDEMICTEPPVDRPLPAVELAAAATSLGFRADSCPDPGTAIELGLARRRPGELLLVAGSLFLVALARERLAGRRPAPAPTETAAASPVRV